MLKFTIIISLVFYFIVSFSVETKANVSSHSHDIEKKDTTFIFKMNGMTLKAHYLNHTDPLGVNMGTIVLLPGWNYSVLDWCSKTSICEKAKSLGYNLVLFDMSKSVYASKTYPETREDMKKYVTRTWLKDSIIPFFQNELMLDYN